MLEPWGACAHALPRGWRHAALPRPEGGRPAGALADFRCQERWGCTQPSAAWWALPPQATLVVSHATASDNAFGFRLRKYAWDRQKLSVGPQPAVLCYLEAIPPRLSAL